MDGITPVLYGIGIFILKVITLRFVLGICNKTYSYIKRKLK